MNGQHQALLSDMLSKVGAVESHVALGLCSTSLQEQEGRPLWSLFISQFPLNAECTRRICRRSKSNSVCSIIASDSYENNFT